MSSVLSRPRGRPRRPFAALALDDTAERVLRAHLDDFKAIVDEQRANRIVDAWEDAYQLQHREDWDRALRKLDGNAHTLRDATLRKVRQKERTLPDPDRPDSKATRKMRKEGTYRGGAFFRPRKGQEPISVAFDHIHREGVCVRPEHREFWESRGRCAHPDHSDASDEPSA